MPRARSNGGGRPRLTDRERACFEAGIKLGGLFHQFVGTPVSSRTARTLARAMEQAVALQPYVTRVKVRVDPDQGPPSGTGRYGYHYLTAEMIRAEVAVQVGGTSVLARLAYRKDLRYPLMELLPDGGPREPSSRGRRGSG
jgi:hypothetical protein